jgi:hypothetical protein
MYKLIEPPFALNFSTMSKRQLAEYYAWFHRIIPERIAELTNFVTRTPRYGSWNSDMTPESLSPLGEWFSAHVETRKRNQEEISKIRSKQTFPIDVPTDELTDRTFSIATDVGIYLGCVILKNVPGTQWEQMIKSKSSVDYGRAVISGFGMLKMNPIRIVINFAYGIVTGDRQGGRLRDLYEQWSALGHAGHA